MAPVLPGDTPFRAVLTWADLRGLCPAETEFLLEAVRVIDAEHLAAQQRKAKAAG